MVTKPSHKIGQSGKLSLTTKPPGPGRCVRVSKIIVYLEPADALAVLKAIDATTAADLLPIGVSGNHQGRAIAAICKQWLGRKA